MRMAVHPYNLSGGGGGRQKNRVQGYLLLCSKQEVSLSHVKICLQTERGETGREWESREWEGKARIPSLCTFL